MLYTLFIFFGLYWKPLRLFLPYSICILYMLLLKQRDISISIPAKINGLVVEKPQM